MHTWPLSLVEWAPRSPPPRARIGPAQAPRPHRGESSESLYACKSRLYRPQSRIWMWTEGGGRLESKRGRHAAVVHSNPPFAFLRQNCDIEPLPGLLEPYRGLSSGAHERQKRHPRRGPRPGGIRLEGPCTLGRSCPPSCGLRGSLVYSLNTPEGKSWTAPHIAKRDMGSLLTHPIYPHTF